MKKKYKIAIIGSRGYPYVYSGYETLVKELSERLINHNFKVRVYCHRSLFKSRPKSKNGIELIYTPSIETKFLSQIVNSFFSFIHVCFSKADIILVLNTANGPYGIITKLFNKKTCINVDGLEWLRPKWKGLGSLYFRISSKLSILFFDEIITDSEKMSIYYEKKFKKKSAVICYGSTMTETTEINIKNLGFKKNEYYLIVGRLVPDNNSLLIIKSFIKSKSNKKLVIVGDVPYNDIYALNIKKFSSNKVIFTGYVKCQKKLTILYKNCFAYIHGHEFGGTNPTMINALYLNCNIISLKTPFNYEMLLGKEAVLFDKNIESAVKALQNFEKNNLYYKEKNKNYKIPEKYNWNFIVKKYIDLFNKILKSKVS